MILGGINNGVADIKQLSVDNIGLGIGGELLTFDKGRTYLGTRTVGVEHLMMDVVNI